MNYIRSYFHFSAHSWVSYWVSILARDQLPIRYRTIPCYWSLRRSRFSSPRPNRDRGTTVVVERFLPQAAARAERQTWKQQLHHPFIHHYQSVLNTHCVHKTENYVSYRLRMQHKIIINSSSHSCWWNLFRMNSCTVRKWKIEEMFWKTTILVIFTIYLLRINNFVNAVSWTNSWQKTVVLKLQLQWTIRVLILVYFAYFIIFFLKMEWCLFKLWLKLWTV